MSSTWAGDDKDALSAGTHVAHLAAWIRRRGFRPAEPRGRAPNRALWTAPVTERDATGSSPAGLEDMHPAVAVGVVASWDPRFVIAALLIGAGLLMAHFGAHGRLGHWDEHVNQWFAAAPGFCLEPNQRRLHGAGGHLGIAAVATVVTVVLLLRRWGRLAWLLAAGLAVELSVFLVTNYAVERPRPHVAHLGSTPSTSSWPSGHVAATTVALRRDSRSW